MLLAEAEDVSFLQALIGGAFAPWLNVEWGDWGRFWALLVVGQRALTLYLLPVMLALAFAPAAAIRPMLITVSLAAIAYFFGPPYVVFWLLLCVGLHRLTQQLEREFRRTDVWAWGPAIAAWGIIGGGFLLLTLAGSMHRQLYVANAWLYEHARWAFPFGFRGYSWEPDFASLWKIPPGEAPPMMFIIGFLTHYIGLAYLAMRMLHYVSELSRNTIPAGRRTLVNFLAYVCYFPTLVQGPLERYRNFQDELDTCATRRGPRDLAIGLGRVTFGVFQCVFAVLYLEPWVLELGAFRPGSVYYNAPEQVASYWTLYFGVFAPVFWLYLHFSGYSDMVIGMSRVIGVRIGENFGWPWFATSLTELWRRWHISLSSILRDYVFTPLTRMRVSPKLNLVITFVFCGLWHGLEMKFVCWAITMGLMVNVNHSWSRWMRDVSRRGDSRVGRLRAAWMRLHPLPSICSWLLTIHAFALSTVFFFGSVRSWRIWVELVRRPGEALLSITGIG